MLPRFIKENIDRVVEGLDNQVVINSVLKRHFLQLAVNPNVAKWDIQNVAIPYAKNTYNYVSN